MSNKRSKLGIWIQAIRAFSFPASMVPVFLAAAIAFLYTGPITWGFLPIIVICALSIHIATNLINDYYDFISGVDKEHTLGSSGILANGLLSPSQIRNAGILFFLLAFSLGLTLVALRGITMLIIGLIGIIGGLFYTAPPFGYKYKALGDPFVFILMGPLMVIGSFYALTGILSIAALYISLPIGFLVTAILHGNNMRDSEYDKQAKVKTIANTIGATPSKVVYLILITCAYLSIIAMIIFKVVPLWSLLVFMSLPIAIKNIKTVFKSSSKQPKALATIDASTAQLHLGFGAIFIFSFLIYRFTG